MHGYLFIEHSRIVQRHLWVIHERFNWFIHELFTDMAISILYLRIGLDLCRRPRNDFGYPWHFQLMNSITQVIHSIIRLLNGIIRLLNGLTRLINGWGAGLGPGAAALANN